MKIIDNISETFGDDLKQELARGSKVKIAASCFSIYAFEALKEQLSEIESLEFIFTSPTFVAGEATDILKKEKREYFIPKLERENSLYGSQFEIHLRNKLTQRAIAEECAEWIRGDVTFRSNKTRAPMQQFAHVENEDTRLAYMPISGFTASDLGFQKSDAVSNIVNRFDDVSHTKTYLEIFEQIWNDPEKLEDVTDIVCDHIQAVYQENAPDRIYFLILYNIFNEFLEDISEDTLPNDLTGYQDSQIWDKLFNFQRDAAIGIINKLETYNGCILADSVGLGKTFTALGVIKYYELRNKSVLVLAPKKLADNWSNYNSNLTTNIFPKDRFNYDVLNHTDLSRTSGVSNGIPLNKVNWGNYDLVVIDESHNFRNNEVFKDRETRYQRLMDAVIRSGVKTKVLMLSATPVNNRFTDLRNQLALAYEGESQALSQKLKTQTSVEEIFRRAQKAFNDWSKQAPHERTAESILQALDFDFFELLDSVTIARSRKHIETFYDTSEIGKFPERMKPVSHHCRLTDREDVPELNDIVQDLTSLNLSVYAPLNFVLPSRRKKYEDLYDTELGDGKSIFRHTDREKSLQALMTTNLLKRLESSVEAFRITLTALLTNMTNALDTIERFEKTKRDDQVSEVDVGVLGDEDEELSGLDGFEIGSKIRISLADMDLTSWKQELESDAEIVRHLLREMQKISPADDVKLQHLISTIRQKVANPINAGNKKVLVFTAFADTANYLYQNLKLHLHDENGLSLGRVSGSDTPKSTFKEAHDFQSLLTVFAPKAKERDLVMADCEDDLDVLIGTDCISEGQNLQDCDYLINYDIHWNPVRIIQRFGRIDRIGSPNEKIQLVNYWPDISLDDYINLKERVENRMVIADVTATGDDNPLTAKANDVSYRRDQLQRLQDEVIELEDVKTGVNITDLGLNDFRMDLLNYVKEHGEIRNAAKGMHAVVPAGTIDALHPGVIFALRNVHEDVNINQQNRLHPYYLVYISNEGEILANHTEVKRLLDLVRTACRGRNEPVANVCRIFNELSDEGRDMAAQSELLTSAIASIIDVKEEKDIDSLFSGGATSALVHAVKGLDDFELIAFLVVQDEG